ncbi:MAG: hypothetical protein M1834_003016 [Cirrosporium novae-zelandiae]|nr:MAG: hypothetical protein M1834_003016 [Cirrosporium novae-zelandiae]
MPPNPPRPPLTHFLCLPLVTESSRPHLQESLVQFTSRINSLNFNVREEKDILPEQAVRPLGTLHLTIGVMSLKTQEALDGALKLLGELDVDKLLREAGEDARNKTVGGNQTQRGKAPATDSLNTKGSSSVSTRAPRPTAADRLQDSSANFLYNPSKPNPRTPSPRPISTTATQPSTQGPLTVSLHGLHPMHKPNSTSILYANPQDKTSRLHPFCTCLRSIFQSSSYVLPDDRPLLLHITIFNTIYASSGSQSHGHGKGRKGKWMIDASQILKDFGEYDWMSNVRVEKIAICEMGAKKIRDKRGNIIAEEYTEVGYKKLV